MFRFLKRFFMIFACLLGIIFAIFLVDSVEVSADVTDIVQLSVEQTRALYGDSISAQYYTDSNSWADCTFQYLGSSYGMLNRDNNLTSGGYVQSDINILFNSDWLFYGLAYDDIYLHMNANNSQFQFRFVPSVNVQGIAYFRQIVGSSRSSSTGSGFDPWRSAYYTACGVSFSNSRQVFYGAGSSTSSTDSPANIYFTPSPLGISQSVAAPSSMFSFCDIYLQNIDSETGLEQTFSLNEFIFRPSRVSFVTLSFYDGEGLPWIEKNYYLIAVSCPRLTDGYVLPDVPSPTPDLSSQLDSLIDVNTQSNTTLQQILAKLNLIYQAMQREEQTPTLQDPEHIGFDSRTKSEILDGMRDGARALDSQSIPEAAQQAAGGVWAVSDRLLDCAPGLASVYLFIFIIGVVSWVIFGKRGG